MTNTALIVPGLSGSITITQDGRFGDLQGKAMALEPRTGFTFDTRSSTVRTDEPVCLRARQFAVKLHEPVLVLVSDEGISTT